MRNSQLEDLNRDARRMTKIMEIISTVKAADVIRQMFIELYEDIGYPTEEDEEFEISVNSINTNTNINRVEFYPNRKRKYFTEYSEIAHKINEVGYDTDVIWHTEIRKMFDGIELLITTQQKCKLPDEEVHMLRMLGKIHDEVQKVHGSYVSTSVVCPS